MKRLASTLIITVSLVTGLSAATLNPLRLFRAKTYQLTVHGGSGTGKYKAGTVVTVVAKVTPGTEYDGWNAFSPNGVMITPDSATTQIVMPATNVTVLVKLRTAGAPPGTGITPVD